MAPTSAPITRSSGTEAGLDDRDLEAALAGRGRDLGADPAGPDHDDRATAVQPLAQGVGVLDAAQV